jgi:hypothetical protein
MCICVGSREDSAVGMEIRCGLEVEVSGLTPGKGKNHLHALQTGSGIDSTS